MIPTSPLIGIIEDEVSIRKFLRTSLQAEGFSVLEAASAREWIVLAKKDVPDVLIIDLGLPDRDGKDLIKEIRSSSMIPIIILSARDQEKEKIAALDAGADDYLTKPFSMAELFARLRVALRHRQQAEKSTPEIPAIYEYDGVRVDLVTRRVFREGNEVKLTKLEFKLLELMIHQSGRVLTHRWLLKEIWGPHQLQEVHHLRVFVANLRKKLERDTARPSIILTETGIGYRLADSSFLSPPS